MKQKHILLVEDEKLIANAYQLMLRKEGYKVDVAYDGQQALQVMEKCVYDLILLDVILPYIDGFELMERKNKQGFCKETPIIILSNLKQDIDIKKGKELGAVDYLIKTENSLNDVLAKVKEVLESSQEKN